MSMYCDFLVVAWFFNTRPQTRCLYLTYYASFCSFLVPFFLHHDLVYRSSRNVLLPSFLWYDACDYFFREIARSANAVLLCCVTAERVASISLYPYHLFFSLLSGCVPASWRAGRSCPVVEDAARRAALLSPYHSMSIYKVYNPLLIYTVVSAECSIDHYYGSWFILKGADDLIYPPSPRFWVTNI